MGFERCAYEVGMYQLNDRTSISKLKCPICNNNIGKDKDIIMTASRVIFQCEWIDLRTLRTAGYGNVSDIPIGIVEDCKLALRRGIYSFLDESDCEGCGGVGKVQVYKDKILCDECLERAE